MSPSRTEQVFYNAHAKVSHYALRHTSHRLRSALEHGVLILAVSAFTVVLMSQRTFVHRADVASMARAGEDATTCGGAGAVDAASEGYHSLGIIGEGRGVSIYSIVVQLLLTGYAWMASKPPFSNAYPWHGTSWAAGKTIPGSCLKGIVGFSEDTDVNHILLRYEGDTKSDAPPTSGSQAFTIHKGSHEGETIVSGRPLNSTQHFDSCVIGASPQSSKRRRQPHNECSPHIASFLARHGYVSRDFLPDTVDAPPAPATSGILYSYSHAQGLLRLPPALQHRHNASTQFVLASTADASCFGAPFARGLMLRLAGPDTVILNWIVGLPRAGRARPRFVYHWKTKKELDLDAFDMDHYAFSSTSTGGEGSGSVYETMLSTPTSPLPFASMNKIIARVQKYPMYHFLRFLTFKFLVLLSTLLIFFLSTSLVSFTFQETQDRMLEFTLQLQTRVRARRSYHGLVLNHVLENLVFVPIMVGMIFFLIEFYGDTFLAFVVLSVVWVCEVFSAISVRSAQGMHYFPRVFFLYFTLFHVYFFSCPIGFTYAALASCVLFLCHTMLFFWNRYELPAIHDGLVTPQNPRMARLGAERGRDREEVDGVPSPHRIQPSLITPRSQQELPPLVPSLNNRSSTTAPTAPLSSTTDFTTPSDQQHLLRPGPMRSFMTVASTSLQSLQSFASVQSSSSLAAERATSPNLIFQGGYDFHESEEVGDSEEDSYIARLHQ